MHSQKLHSTREEPGQAMQEEALLHMNLPVGMVALLGSSPGRGEGLPIFLPLNGESRRCFQCAGQSDSLPDVGLHY